MAANIHAMYLSAWRITELFEKGILTIDKVALTKAWVTAKGREVVSLARELLGGNGILLDNHVMKQCCDMESLYTYEGSYDINVLVAGRQLTGIPAFK